MKKVEFNHADYSFMDDMPLEGWIWEIIRRFQEYKRRYDEILKLKTNKYLPEKEKDSEIIKLVKEIQDVVGLLPKIYGEKATKWYQTVGTFLVISEEKKFKEKISIGLPNPKLKYIDFKNDLLKPNMLNISHLITVFDFNTLKEFLTKKRQASVESFYDLFFMALTSKTNKPSYFKEPEALYIKIPKKCSIAEIENLLIPELKNYLEPRKIRIRTDKWKYYLISYDLKQSGLDIPEIADILAKAYPSDNPDKTFSEKNIEYYHRSALSMINGEYKKYLYLEK